MTKITMTANKGQTHVQRAVSGATRLFFVLVLCLIIAPAAWSGYQEGKDAYNRKDYATARKELQPVAEQGDAEAQYLIGYMYYNEDRRCRGHKMAWQGRRAGPSQSTSAPWHDVSLRLFGRGGKLRGGRKVAWQSR